MLPVSGHVIRQQSIRENKLATMQLRVLLGVLFISVSGAVSAAEARLGPVVIDVPSEFTGPSRTIPNEDSTVDTYVATVNPGGTANVLQLSHMTIVSIAPNLREETLYAAASDFLAGTLKFIEERRTKWSQSKTKKVWLDGHVGARAEWAGNLDGRPTIGVTYCVIVGNHGYYFNAFGIGTEPNAALKSSIRAIEGLRVEAANQSLERSRER
jgi:hypothetical protein